MPSDDVIREAETWIACRPHTMTPYDKEVLIRLIARAMAWEMVSEKSFHLPNERIGVEFSDWCDAAEIVEQADAE